MKLKYYITNGWPENVLKDNTGLFYKFKNEMTLVRNLILLGTKVVIPESLIPKKTLHQGHPGITRMTALAKNNVFWPGMTKDIERHVKNCNGCIIAQKANIKTNLSPWAPPKTPWERIHLDYAGPYNGIYLEILVDAYSKWPMVKIMEKARVAETMENLEEYFSSY